YQKTLPGSGGLDPNPDLEAGQTMRHDYGAQDTMVNMRPVNTQQNARYQPPAQPVPPPPSAMNTMPGAAVRPGLPPRQSAAGGRRRILGCSPTCLMVFAGLLATFCG